MTTFTDWLESEMKKRGWFVSDLARAADLSQATLTNVLNGRRNAGTEVCLAIARALRIPPENVYREAGLLPPLPSGDLAVIQELSDLVRRLPEEERGEILDYARYRYQRYTKRYQTGEGTER